MIASVYCSLPIVLYISHFILIIIGKSTLYYPRQGGYVFSSFGLFVCLVVLCSEHYSKSYQRLVFKFYGSVRGGKRNK